MLKKMKSLFIIESHKDIMTISFVLYFTSFFMLGLVSSNELMPSLIILLLLPIAWLGIEDIGVLAVYANIFYFVAVLFKNNKKALFTSFFTLFIASGIFIFRAYPAGTSGYLATIYSWGWGAVFWYSAMLLATLAFCVKSQIISVKNARRMISVYTLFVVLPIIGLSIYQHKLANSQEQEKYLPFGTAFTRMPLSGFDFVSEEMVSTIPKDKTIEIVHNFDLPETSHYGMYPIRLPDKYIQFGYEWQTSFYDFYKAEKRYENNRFLYSSLEDERDKNMAVAIAKSELQSDFIFSIQKINDDLVNIQLTNASKAIVYKQKIRRVDSVNDYEDISNKKSIYIPYIDDVTNKILSNHFLADDKKILGTSIDYDASRDCDFRKADSSIKNLVIWHGKLVRFSPYDTLSDAFGFCHNDYLIKVNIFHRVLYSRQGKAEETISISYQIFDKETLKFIKLEKINTKTKLAKPEIIEKVLSEL